MNWSNLRKGVFLNNKIKEAAIDQEVPVPKKGIFDSKHPIFIRVHPAFEQKSEGRKYQNSMTLVAMEVEKYQWNVMVEVIPDDLYDYTFGRNLFSLVELQTLDMDFQLEVQTYIWDVTVKVKIKATLHSLGGQCKTICTQWKIMGETDKQVTEIILKKTESSGSGRKQASLSSMWVTK